MEKLLKGLITFQEEVFLKKKELFTGLSGHQKPRAVFVTCSDSRIDPTFHPNRTGGFVYYSKCGEFNSDLWRGHRGKYRLS